MFPLSMLVVALLTAGPRTVAVNPLRGVAVPNELAAFCTEQLGAGLLAEGLKVTTPGDVATLLGVERQKQLLGCDDGSSCLAELVAALGAEAIVVGSVARLASQFQVTVKVLDPARGTVFATAESSAASEDQLVPALRSVARQLARQLNPSPKPSPGLTLGVPLGVAGAAAVVGAVLLAVAAVQANALVQPLAVGEAPLTGFEGRIQSVLDIRNGGLISLGVAVAAAAVGVVWTVASSGPASPPLSLRVLPSWNHVAVVVEFQ